MNTLQSMYHKHPNLVMWAVLSIGMAIYVVLMATAFMGYLLPWGQMSLWGAQVIVNLFNTVPLVGNELSTWIRGDFVMSDATLNRFFALHFFLPVLILPALVFVHIVALHAVGSNNPDGVEIKQGPKGNRWEETAPKDGIPFHPYYTVKDILGVAVFLLLQTFFGQNPYFVGTSWVMLWAVWGGTCGAAMEAWRTEA